jgi:foldase protein PrsA
MKTGLKVLIASLAVAAVVGAAGYALRDKIMGMVDKTSYVATVGKQKITEDQYRYFLISSKNSIEQNAGVQNDADRKKLWESKVGEQSAEEVAKQQALDTSKTFTILLSKAKAANYKLESGEIKSANEQLDNYVASLGEGAAGAKAFEAEFGMTLDKVKAVNLQLSLVQKYYADQMKNTTATDEEIKKFYDENVQAFQQVTVKHVLFMTIDQATNQPLPQDKQDESKKKAEDVLAKIKAGTNIADMAKQYSEDPGSKDNGGEYTFGRGEMVKEFEDWSFNAKVGDVGVVKTDYGYHVIRLEKIIGFEDVKESIKGEVSGKKFNDELENLLKSSEYTVQKNEKVLSNIKVLK